MNGTYAFVYSGELGLGMGIFQVSNSVLIGIDLGGVRYRGSAMEDFATGEIDLAFEMTVPAGTSLVQSTSPQEIPYTKNGNAKVPPGFGNGKPFDMFIAPGIVTLMVHRVSDDYALYVNGVTIQIQAAT